jgi:hypothetical protein
VDGFHEILAPRAKALLDHPDRSVRDFAAETVKEVEVFENAETVTGMCLVSFNAATTNALHGFEL